MKKILAIILMLCTLCLSSCGIFEHCTTDINKYGKYDNCVGESEINFFPELNKDIMSNFKYSYNVDCFIDCAHEIYLEFTIEDEAEFTNFIEENKNSITQSHKDVVTQKFKYDEAYTEVVIEDLIKARHYDDGELAISFAYIKKMIYCEETNSIIFVNLYVVDYWKFENSTYIERFDINPQELSLGQ